MRPFVVLGILINFLLILHELCPDLPWWSPLPYTPTIDSDGSGDGCSYDPIFLFICFSLLIFVLSLIILLRAFVFVSKVAPPEVFYFFVLLLTESKPMRPLLLICGPLLLFHLNQVTAHIDFCERTWHVVLWIIFHDLHLNFFNVLVHILFFIII